MELCLWQALDFEPVRRDRRGLFGDGERKAWLCAGALLLRCNWRRIEGRESVAYGASLCVS